MAIKAEGVTRASEGRRREQGQYWVYLDGEVKRLNAALGGLDVDAADVDEALSVNAAEWRDEVPKIEEWFEFVGEKLPTGLKDEFDGLKHRLG